jgi:hypothetical protein
VGQGIIRCAWRDQPIPCKLQVCVCLCVCVCVCMCMRARAMLVVGCTCRHVLCSLHRKATCTNASTQHAPTHTHTNTRKQAKRNTHTYTCGGSLAPKRARMRPSSTGEARGRGALLAAAEVRGCNHILTSIFLQGAERPGYCPATQNAQGVP